MGAAAHVYVMSHPTYKALKVGVAGGKGRQTARIDQHTREGWLLYRAMLLPSRPHAGAVEKAVLHELRVVRGLPSLLTSAQMPQSGWTETVSAEAIQASELWELVVKFAESVSEAVPPRMGIPHPRPSEQDPEARDRWPERVQDWLAKNWGRVRQGAVVRTWVRCRTCGPDWWGDAQETAGWTDDLCRYCAAHTEDLERPGRVMVMHHRGHAASLVQAVSTSDRGAALIDKHRAQGWRLHAALRCRDLHDAIRIEQGVLHRLSDDGLQPFVQPDLMPQFGSDGTVDARWMPAAALWSLVNVEATLRRAARDRYVDLSWAEDDADRDIGWVARMPASAEERRRRDLPEFFGPFRPGAPWWEGVVDEDRAAQYELYESLRRLPRTNAERLRREAAALGLTA